ncbi:MAG: exonuclease domain-containing protein [Campylobacterales bacterium]
MLIFLDTQTTGLEKTDKICSIAVITGDKEFYELVNEGKKIPPLASSIHHITNEMIKDKTPLKDSEIFKFLEENNNEETTIVGHNVKFDLEKLSEIGFYFKGKIIDTLRVTKHLIQECELFSLQFLRYELRLYKNEPLGIVAHNALGNTLLVRELFNYLLDITTLEDMYNLSFKKVLLEKFSFGKYAGRYIEEISMQDRGYLEWMLRDISDLDEDLRYSVKYYLGDNLEDCY